MDFALDNKASDIDNTTEVLISNANTDIKVKTDDANGISETGDQQKQNDSLNNIIGLTATNNIFADFIKETISHDVAVISSNIGKNSFESDVDMGPETSVDTTDDIDHDTDLFECSPLSHSKETLPSSDNPLDFQDQQKIISPTSSFNDEFSAEQLGAKDLNTESYNMDNPFRDEPILGEDNIESDLKSEITQTIESHIKTILDPISYELQNINEMVEQVVINEPKTPELIQDIQQFQEKYEDETLLYSKLTDENVIMPSVPEVDIEGNSTDIFNIDATPFNTKYNIPELKTEEYEPEIIEKNVDKTERDNFISKNFDNHSPKNDFEQEFILSSEDEGPGHDEYHTEGNNVGESKNTQEKFILTKEEIVKKLSTDDESKLQDQLDLQMQEQIENKVLTSSDTNELNIDLDNKVEEEEAEIDLKDKTEELESITPHESCDESADEWNYMKSKGEETKEVDSERTLLEANVYNESQESEELIKKDSEEKISATSVEHSENFKIKYSESLDKEVEDMTSQLNPEAKEFVPTTSPSPPLFEIQSDTLLPAVAHRSNGDVGGGGGGGVQRPQQEIISMSDILTTSEKELETETDVQSSDIVQSSATIYDGFDIESITGILPQMTQCLKSDEVVAQSPRKGAISMEDLQIPSENEFEKDIASKPFEIATSEIYPAFDLNETMQNSENVELVSPEEQYGNSTFESADMRTSIYVETAKTQDVLNKVQELPNDIEDFKDIEKPSDFMIDLTNTSDLESPKEQYGLANNSNLCTKNESILSIASDDPIELLPAKTNTNDEILLNEAMEDLKFEQVAAIANTESIVKTELNNKLNKVPDVKKNDVKPTKMVATSGPKKVLSTASTLTDNSKAKTAQTTSKTKVSASTTLATRPRTAPVSSSKPLSIEKKPPTDTVSARPKIESKVAPALGVKKLPLTKPKIDEPKIGAARPLPTKGGISTKPNSRIALTTSTTATAKRVPISTSCSSTTKTLGQRPVSCTNSKLAPVSGTTTSKPAISPRSTIASSLRKAEAVKSPTAGKKLTSVRSATTTITNTTSTKITAKPVGGTTLNKAAAATSNSAARKLPSTVTKKTTAIKKSSATSSAETTKQKTSDEFSSIKTGTFEIKMNGSSKVENRD